MNQKIQNTITNSIAETLFIPLLMKSNESRKKDAFFKDDVSCEIIDRINYDFSNYQKAVRSSVGVAIRSNYFDQVAKEFIQKHENPVLVNIGCGLDTRFFRMGKEVTDRAIVYELDLEEVIDMRKQLLSESENNPYLSASMFGTNWMDELKKRHPQANFLFIAEGVFMFFTNEQIKDVMTQLAKRFSNAKLSFDVTSTWMSKNSHKHDSLKYIDAKFRLCCDDDREMEAWADNLRFQSVKLYSDFEEWKRVGLKYRLMMHIPSIKRASRLLTYEIL